MAKRNSKKKNGIMAEEDEKADGNVLIDGKFRIQVDEIIRDFINDPIQLALERHMNGHFCSDSTQHANPKKSVENSSAKLLKRNGKKIRFRRQPWSARMFDFIDAGMMEGLQHRLLTMTEKRTNGRFDSTDGQTVTLSSQILAKRVEVDGTRKFLLRWHPNDIVDDEWILENDYRTTQTVQIPRLQPNAKDNLRPILFPRSCNYRNSQAMSCSGPAKHQRKRKPRKTNT